MRTITIREACEGLSHLEQLFADDDEVIIARRGEPVARILPIKSAKPKTRSLAEFGALFQQGAMAISCLAAVALDFTVNRFF